MNRIRKLLLGFVSIIPILISVLCLGVFISIFQGNGEDVFRYLIEHQAAIGLFNSLLLVLSQGPVIFYIIHAARNSNLADRKAVWIIAMVLCGGFALPIYWFMFIWQERYYEE